MRLYQICSMQLDNWAEDLREAADLVEKYLPDATIDLENIIAEMQQEAEAIRSKLEPYEIMTDAYVHPWIKHLDMMIHDMRNIEIERRNALVRLARNLCNSVAARIEASEVKING